MALLSWPWPTATPADWRSGSSCATYVAKSQVVGWVAEPSQAASVVALLIWSSSEATWAASTLPAAAWKVANEAMTSFCGMR